MKSIHAFIVFVSILSVGISSGPLYGLDPLFTFYDIPYTLSLESGAGVLLGHSEEIVYKYSDRDDYLSELRWDLKPMVYVGAALGFSRAHPLDGLGAETNLSVKFGLPLLSGTMEDRDWNNPSNEDPRLTNFSSHDAYIQRAIMVDFSGGVSIPLGSAVMIKPLVSLSYMRFSWIAQNGYTEYESDGWKRKYIQGVGISYDQSWLILSPGIGLTWPVLRALSLDMNLFISPLIVCSDVDIHKLTKNEYHDYMRGGFYWEPALDCIFSPVPNISLTFHGSWRSITGLRGDTMQLPIGSSSGTSFIGQAGAAYSAFDLGISLKLRL